MHRISFRSASSVSNTFKPLSTDYRSFPKAWPKLPLAGHEGKKTKERRDRNERANELAARYLTQLRPVQEQRKLPDLAMLLGRLNINTLPADVLHTICTHASFGQVPEQARRFVTMPNTVLREADNTRLAQLGQTLLLDWCRQWLMAKYPLLPSYILEKAIQAYVGRSTVIEVCKEWGADDYIAWSHSRNVAIDGHWFQPTEQAQSVHDLLYDSFIDKFGDSFTTREKENESDEHFQTEKDLQQAKHVVSDQMSQEEVRKNEEDAYWSLPLALIGALHEQGAKAQDFAHLHFFQNRAVDFRPFFKSSDPKKLLREKCKELGRERPVMRMIAETGRFSHTPIFVVAAYSGKRVLGEGFGTSIAMAEHRAATNALINYYLHQPLRVQSHGIEADVLVKEGVSV